MIPDVIPLVSKGDSSNIRLYQRNDNDKDVVVEENNLPRPIVSVVALAAFT